MRLMSSSGIHGSVTRCWLLHLRYVDIKLPPAGFLSLKRGKKPTQTTECFWKSSSVSSGPVPGAKSSSVPQLLFCLLWLTWPQKHAWSCTVFFQLHMALQCWIDLCAKVHLIRSFYLCLPACLQSICFFLSHEVQVAVLATVMSSRHTELMM